MSPWLAVVALLAIAAIATVVAVAARRAPQQEAPEPEPAPSLAPQHVTRVAPPAAQPVRPTHTAPTPRSAPPATPPPRPSKPPVTRSTSSPRPIPPGVTPQEAPRLAVPSAGFQSLLPDPEDLSESEDDKPTIAMQASDAYDVDALAAELDESQR